MPLPKAMTALELGAWLLLIATVAAFVGYGGAEYINRRVLRPWKRELKARGAEPGWWWTAIVGGVSATLGAYTGSVLGGYTPVGDQLVGLLVGFGAGALPAAIVKAVRANVAKAAGRER